MVYTEHLPPLFGFQQCSCLAEIHILDGRHRAGGCGGNQMVERSGLIKKSFNIGLVQEI